MQEIKAIIRPDRLDDVLHALHMLNLPGVTVSTVTGYGRRSTNTAEGGFGEKPFVKLEIVVDEVDASAVLSRIEGAARTGRAGDGKIFVIPVTEAVKIRSGARGADAL